MIIIALNTFIAGSLSQNWRN